MFNISDANECAHDSELASEFQLMLDSIRADYDKFQFHETDTHNVFDEYDFLHELLNCVLCERFYINARCHESNVLRQSKVYVVELMRFRESVYDRTQISAATVLEDSFVYVFTDIADAMRLVSRLTTYCAQRY